MDCTQQRAAKRWACQGRKRSARSIGVGRLVGVSSAMPVLDAMRRAPCKAPPTNGSWHAECQVCPKRCEMLRRLRTKRTWHWWSDCNLCGGASTDTSTRATSSAWYVERSRARAPRLMPRMPRPPAREECPRPTLTVVMGWSYSRTSSTHGRDRATSMLAADTVSWSPTRMSTSAGAGW